MLGSEVVEGGSVPFDDCRSIAIGDATHILIVEVSEAVAGVARTYRTSAMRLWM